MPDKVQLGQGIRVGEDAYVYNLVVREGRIDHGAVVPEPGRGAREEDDLLPVGEKTQPVGLVGEGVVVGAAVDRGLYRAYADGFEIPAAAHGVISDVCERVEEGEGGDSTVFKCVKPDLADRRRQDDRLRGEIREGALPYRGDRAAVKVCGDDQLCISPVIAGDGGLAGGCDFIVEVRRRAEGTVVRIEVQRDIFGDEDAAAGADEFSFAVRERGPAGKERGAVLRDERNRAGLRREHVGFRRGRIG